MADSVKKKGKNSSKSTKKEYYRKKSNYKSVKEKDKDKIIILVIHNLRTAIKYCSRLILLSEGNIVKDGTVEEVITEENLNNVFRIKTKVYYNEISKFLDFYII